MKSNLLKKKIWIFWRNPFSGVSIDDSVVGLSSEESSNDNQRIVVDKATPCPSLGEEKEDTVPTQPDMLFCRHCGKKIEADSSFVNIVETV